MTKQELSFVKKIYKSKQKLIKTLCDIYPNDFVYDNTKIRERIFRIIDEIDYSIYMLNKGLENRKIIKKANTLLKKVQKK